MFDLHCHLLPGIDDGAVDLEMALGERNRLMRDPDWLNDEWIRRKACVAPAQR